MNPHFRISLQLAVVLFAGVFAASSAVARDVVPVDEFLEALDTVESNLREGKPRQLKKSEWKEFEEIQEDFQELLSDVENIDALSSKEQIEVFNLQEELDTLLVGREREQVVCQEVKRTGSRIPRRRCVTVGQREAIRVEAQQILTDIPSLMEPPAGR
ncbi:MAG: hypothetical protein U5L08_13450 [Xanthomonadales bacterium]|nr:hypothetical protein [Xanthomonadales bacterium]